MSTSLRFKAVNDALATLYETFRRRLLEARIAGRNELSTEVIASLATLARGLAHDAVTDGYRTGCKDGRRAALEDYGLPAERDPDSEEGTPTVPLHLCPGCGFPHRRLNPSRPGTAGGAPR